MIASRYLYIDIDQSGNTHGHAYNDSLVEFIAAYCALQNHVMQDLPALTIRIWLQAMTSQLTELEGTSQSM